MKQTSFYHFFEKKANLSLWLVMLAATSFFSCSGGGGNDPTPQPDNYSLVSWSVDGINSKAEYIGVKPSFQIRLQFSNAIDRNTVQANILLRQMSGTTMASAYSFEKGDSLVVLSATAPLSSITRYKVTINSNLRSKAGGLLATPRDILFLTGIDSTRKFPAISDNALLDKVQQQTFKYFWDYGHPVSGLSRERSNGGDNVVTSGGSGFGIMTILVGIERGFISRADGLARMQTIVGFLKNTAKTIKGAYSHWLDGGTGFIIPFSSKDNGADLVETSYLIQGLLCARQYFNQGTTAESTLRDDINTIWHRVEWDWFRRGGQDVLYWHYSEDYQWDMNLPIRGWNECLVTYVLAASSPTHSIPKSVYTAGWASNGSAAFVNGNSYYGYRLPLGSNMGGPLFFAHYSFLGINPNGLSDVYANYADQTRNHTLINYSYCKANPNNYFGYSDSIWGLTASDIPTGYSASSPTNDLGVIAPTAALSSFPYTPNESMAALRFFYYVLGDKIWKDYGFIDAFSLKEPWFASSHLAIDQGPIIIMIENYRTGLLWNLFTSCPEVKAGMQTLGFTAPYL